MTIQLMLRSPQPRVLLWGLHGERVELRQREQGGFFQSKRSNHQHYRLRGWILMTVVWRRHWYWAVHHSSREVVKWLILQQISRKMDRAQSSRRSIGFKLFREAFKQPFRENYLIKCLPQHPARLGFTISTQYGTVIREVSTLGSAVVFYRYCILPMLRDICRLWTACTYDR